MKSNRRTYAIAAGIAATMLVAWVATTAAAPAAPGDPEDPSTTPQPAYDYDNDDKSFVVDLQFGASSASLVDATVGTEPSYSHLGDPPQLRLSLTDEDGNPAGSVNSHDPRWSYEEAPGGGEHLVIRESPGTLTLPFDPDAASLLVRDQQAGVDLTTVDLGPAIQEFCVAHPSDPDCVEADLAVTATSATGAPMGTIGQPVNVDVSATVANLGPDGPIDGDVTLTATGSAGVTVAPGSRSLDADGLAVGTPAAQTLTSDVDVTCTTGGAQTVTVTTAIVPEQAKVVDPVAANNSKATTFAIDCAVPVTLNVMPGSHTNPVILTPIIVTPPLLPVAVLTTGAGQYGNPVAFDATKIQPATVRVGLRDPLIAGNTGTPPFLNQVLPVWSIEPDEHTVDLDRDGLLQAWTRQIGIMAGTTEVCVRGRFGPGTGTTFFGCDHITLLP